MYNQALIDAGISPYADIIGGEGGQQGGGALSLTIRPDEYVEYTGAPAYLTDILKKGKARNEDEAKAAYAVLSMTQSPEEVAKVLGGYYGYDFLLLHRSLVVLVANFKQEHNLPKSFTRLLSLSYKNKYRIYS